MPRSLPPPPVEPLIAALPEVVRPLAQRAAIIRFARGELLIREGERGDTLYIVLSGTVRAFSGHAVDAKQITFAHYGPGEYVGEMSLDGGQRSASVEATEPTCCAMVTRRTLTAHITEHPEFAFALLEKVIWRARVATSSARKLVLSDTYGRLKAELESLARPGPDGALRISPKPTHQALGQRSFVERSMVTKLLKDLRAGGYVQEDADGLTLLRPLPARW
jgi:CRP/FNR family cyclic AMP-dependent transcriptional regulator